MSIVIPAFNEALGLETTLQQVVAAFPEAEIIVVDDGSTDETATIARRANVRVVRHAYNRGQGGSLKTGMRQSRRMWVAWFDADNEHRTEDLARLVKRAQDSKLVAVIGQRLTNSATLTRALGKLLIRWAGRGLRINAGHDLNCGLRVFRRDIIVRYLPLIPDRFSASLVTTLIMIERRYPIAFEPIETNPRIGRSTVRLRDGFDAILVLVRSVLLFAPLRVFLPLGCGLILIGLVYSLLMALHFGAGFPVAGMLVMTVGFLCVILGLVADQISQFRLGQLSEASTFDEAADIVWP